MAKAATLVCDTCGEPIKYIEDGWVEWLQEMHGKEEPPMVKGLRIVHHWRPRPGQPFDSSPVDWQKPCHTYESEPSGWMRMDHHLNAIVERFKTYPEEGDEWYRRLVAGDSEFRPYSTMERLRSGSGLPTRKA
jgi:hypothetical protein